MGSYKGHVLPGAYFILFGTYLTCTWIYQYATRKTNNQSKQRSSFEKYSGLCLGCIVTLSTFLGIVLEQVVDDGPNFSLTRDGHFDQINNWSHSVMYSFFMMYGVIQVSHSTNPSPLKNVLRNSLLSLSLFVEGFLFYYHLHAREVLEVRIHVLLIFAVWCGSLLSFLNIFADGRGKSSNLSQSDSEYIPLTTSSNDVTTDDDTNRQVMTSSSDDVTIVLQMGIGTSVVLQGTWFIQVANILYGSDPWSPDDVTNVMFAAVCFSIHLLAVILYQFGCAFVVNKIVKIFN